MTYRAELGTTAMIDTAALDRSLLPRRVDRRDDRHGCSGSQPRLLACDRVRGPMRRSCRASELAAQSTALLNVLDGDPRDAHRGDDRYRGDAHRGDDRYRGTR